MERTARAVSKRTYVQDSESGGSDGSEGEEHTNKRSRSATQPAARRTARRNDDGDYDQQDDADIDIEAENIHYEAGQITRIDVENFMCHRKFTVHFGRNLNFIAGRNGSGKSAIVAAIQLCLGSSARHTGRGSNVAQYIREGSENPAVLKVTLLNTGADAYKPEEYGEKITVKRVISKQGSTYHLLSAKGVEISKNKSELDSMLRSFNIFVDTPCCILTQEESKRLIHGSPKEKYEFFIKATGLKGIAEELAVAELNVQEALSRREAMKPSVEQAKKHAMDCKAKVEQYQQLMHYDVQIAEETAKLYWDEVRAASGVVERARQEKDRREEDMEQAREALESVKVVDFEAQVDAHDAQIAALKTEKEAVDERVQQANDAWRQAAQTEAGCKRNLTTLKDHKKTHEDRLRKVAEEIRDLKERARQDAGQEERTVRDRMDEVERELERLAEQNSGLEQSRTATQAEAQQFNRELSQASSTYTAKQRRVEELQRDLRNAESGMGNATKFGDQVPQILDKISRTRFRGQVFGPIGMCVTMKEGCERWSYALEVALFQQLRSFVVTSVEDRNTLYGILKSVRADRFIPIILQHPGARMSVEALQQPSDFPTIADTLQINDDIVFNALLDQANIDHVVLAQDERDVVRYLKENVNGDDRLRCRIARVVTEKGVTVSYRGGNQSSEVSRYPHRHLLATDTTAFIASLRDDLRTVELEAQELERNRQALNGQVNRATAEIKRIDEAKTRNNAAIRRAQQEMGNLNAKLAEALENGRVDTTDLEREESERRDALALVINQMEEVQVRLKACGEKLQLAKQELDDARAAQSEVENEIAQHETAIEKLQQKRHEAKRKVDSLERDYQRRKVDFEAAQAELTRVDAILTEKVKIAEEKTRELVENWDGEPLPLTNKETKASIQNKIKRFQTEREEGLRQANLAGFSAQLLTERFRAAEEAFKTIRRQFKEAERNTVLVQQHRELTETKWKESFAHIVKRTKRWFNEYASRQGAGGTVKVDSDAQEMSLIVQIDTSDPKNKKSDDVRNLSGGERSYVTLCLLLALGHVTESPFRLMDEYDVFMDEARRNDTLAAIQQHSQEAGQSSRQIIVITPNSLASVKTSPRVRIFRMPDPVRNGAHGLQQQTMD